LSGPCAHIRPEALEQRALGHSVVDQGAKDSRSTVGSGPGWAIAADRPMEMSTAFDIVLAILVVLPVVLLVARSRQNATTRNR
jgi:hypothetical protein